MFTGSRASKAPPSTRCQRCLKLGHYTYECKESAQNRPYISRPSRTQQLLNPKLVPELKPNVPEEFTKKEGVANEILRKKDEDRKQIKEKEEGSSGRKSRKSKSYRSVSRSRSPSSSRSRSRSKSPKRRHRRRSTSRHRSKPVRESIKDDDADRASEMSSSNRQRSQIETQNSRRQDVFGDEAPPESRSRDEEQGRHRQNNRQAPSFSKPRERSLSPYSRRMALTRSMNDSDDPR